MTNWLLLLISFSSLIKAKNVTRVVALKASFYIETPTNIACEDFEQQWSGIFCDSLILNRQESIEFVVKEINKSRAVDDLNIAVDVRAKIYLFKESGQPDVACFGYSRYFSYNGQMRILNSDSLVNWLQK